MITCGVGRRLGSSVRLRGKTDGTYGTYVTDPIGPIGPIGPIRPEAARVLTLDPEVPPTAPYR